ncbi:MAG: tRNA glutamyl-Q(34) synthetase GluQRS [Tepidisphaeraceae bacterium]|jgi:glutamyl-tRNA synthetase
MPTTRLAPSPTGALHLGNARTFVVNWIMARQREWRILLRIEDLDGPRIKRDADRQAIQDLQWLGLDWDEESSRQSTRADVYRAAAYRLLENGHAYPCICTRSEIVHAASAPHAEDGAAVYPGTCFGKFTGMDQAHAAAGREPAVRFHMPDGIFVFEDGFCGRRRFDLARELGDFVILKGDGTAAYQTAVVIDDAAAGVTDIIRGDDLIDSTPRQAMLYRTLGLADHPPRYWHLPLVVGTDGKRLAKRHGDTRISHYREQGVRPERMLGLLARWCGIAVEEISLREFAEGFVIEKLPAERIAFTPGDDRWLLGK